MAVKRLLLRKARKDREYFRRVILEHLDRLEKEEADGLKAELKKARGFPVGAIREWRGKKYIKKPNGKWSPKYESETRGAKVALAVIKRKITNAKDEREMMNIILENRDRFADKEGSPLPFVMELHEHIKAEQANREKRIKAELNEKKANKIKKRDLIYKRAKEQGIDVKRYSRGTRSARLRAVFDDYINGDLTLDDAAELYTNICPKMSIEGSKETIETVYGDNRKYRQNEDPMVANSVFNEELEKYIKGELPKDHVFNLSKPGGILKKTGFSDAPIEMVAAQFDKKNVKHDFSPEDIKNLPMALQDPVAVFADGDKNKAQNVIVEIEKAGKKFLVGIHFKQSRRGNEVSSIRTIFPKDNAEWLNWINQDKMLYGNKDKIQAVVDQQQTNPADVSYLDLDSINNILDNAGNVKGFYPRESEAEARRNRSEGMKGNQNAKKDGGGGGDDGEPPKVIQTIVRDYGRKIMSEAAGTMTNILDTGESGVVVHKKFGNITIDAGEAKKSSFGLKHIIKQRHDEGKSDKEIAALLILLDGTLKYGEKKRDITFKRQPNHRGRMELDVGGIIAIVSKQRNQGDNEQWVLTGFDDKENKETADTIQKVISRYGYTPEFQGLEKQVGAVVSSLPVSAETAEKSSEAEARRNRSEGMKGNQNAKKDGGGNEPPRFNELTLKEALHLGLLKNSEQRKIFWRDKIRKFYSNGRMSKGEALDRLMSDAGYENLETAKGTIAKWDREKAAEEEKRIKAELNEKSKPRRNDKPLTKGELKTFIEESLADRKAPYKRVAIGKINEDAKKRIWDALGEKVDISEVDIDNHGIQHAVTKLNHNLEPEDLLLATDVINSATDIVKSDKKHQDNDVLVFKKDIDGEITFLTEARVKNGYLLVFDAWRQKKARSRRRSDATQESPGTHAPNVPPRDGSSSVSAETAEKSSDFAKIQEKYRAAKSIDGDEDTINIGGVDGDTGSGKRPASLKDNIHTILHGTPEAKEKLEKHHFHLADTPQFMKELGLTGDFFSTRYGVIIRHKDKDEDHNLTEADWATLCDTIKKPFAIVKRGEKDFRVFATGEGGKIIALGVDVKNAGKSLEVNSISTAFTRDKPITGEVVYRSKKITPDQTAVLRGPNSPQYPPAGATLPVSAETAEKSSDFANKKITPDQEQFIGRTNSANNLSGASPYYPEDGALSRGAVLRGEDESVGDNELKSAKKSLSRLAKCLSFYATAREFCENEVVNETDLENAVLALLIPGGVLSALNEVENVSLRAKLFRALIPFFRVDEPSPTAVDVTEDIIESVRLAMGEPYRETVFRKLLAGKIGKMSQLELAGLFGRAGLGAYLDGAGRIRVYADGAENPEDAGYFGELLEIKKAAQKVKRRMTAA